jgi:hypothetical protein
LAEVAGEVDGGGGFADAAFEGGHGDDHGCLGPFFEFLGTRIFKYSINTGVLSSVYPVWVLLFTVFTIIGF